MPPSFDCSQDNQQRRGESRVAGGWTIPFRGVRSGRFAVATAWLGGLVLIFLGTTFLQQGAPTMAEESRSNNPQLAHMVFFTLKDSSQEAQDRLVAACNRYLKDHPGVVYFSVGTLVEELNRPVNDRDFHVGLHVVFEDKAAHDAYQKAENHLKFIEEGKPNWEQIRVFDTYLANP